MSIKKQNQKSTLKIQKQRDEINDKNVFILWSFLRKK